MANINDTAPPPTMKACEATCPEHGPLEHSPGDVERCAHRFLWLYGEDTVTIPDGNGEALRRVRRRVLFLVEPGLWLRANSALYDEERAAKKAAKAARDLATQSPWPPSEDLRG